MKPRRLLVRTLLAPGCLAVLVAFGTPTSAVASSLPDVPPTVPSGFEIIDDYRVDLTIQSDGTVRVVETIRYDFGDQDKHGIERIIPVSYRWDDDFDRVLPIEDVQVSSDAPRDIEQTHENGNLRIRVGDPDTTITGAHTYSLSYTARGALNGDKDTPAWDAKIGDHDELYWNAIGTEWTVPITKAKVTVHAPAKILDANCYAGDPGATSECEQVQVRGSEAAFVQPGLFPGQGMTVVVALPVGAVPTPTPILDERWSLKKAFTITPVTAGGSGVLLVLIVGGVILLMWRHGRDRIALGGAVDAAFAQDDTPDQATPLFSDDSSPVEFAPPDNIRPGQIGTLVDGVANTLDVTATIIDLACRGFLKIEEVPKEGFFGKDDYRIVSTGTDWSKLLGYERTLLGGLLQGGLTEVLMSDLRLQFATRLEQVENELYADVTRRKWFSARPDKIRQRWALIGFGAFAASILVLVAAVWFTKIALIAVPVVVGALVLWVGARWMPRRTAKGSGLLRRALGFRTFITDSEALRARFAEDNNIFSEYLPYAIVFGCTKKFAKAFEGLEDQMPQNSWYVGSRPFLVASFADDMSSFAVSTGGTLTSTPGSSGSSGFGGGSGGGMGGGGGGSW